MSISCLTAHSRYIPISSDEESVGSTVEDIPDKGIVDEDLEDAVSGSEYAESDTWGSFSASHILCFLIEYYASIPLAKDDSWVSICPMVSLY